MKKYIVILFIISLFVSMNYSNTPARQTSYEAVESEIGCDSTYSKEKRKDIFNSYYKNCWYTWRGKIVRVSSNSVGLNIDGKVLLSVSFADKNAGYHLRKGDFITVRFLMTSAGGCFFPYYGKNAKIIR